MPCPPINLSIFRRYPKSWRLATSCSQPPSCSPLPYCKHWCRVRLFFRRLSTLFRRVDDSLHRLSRNRNLVRVSRFSVLLVVGAFAVNSLDFRRCRARRRNCRPRCAVFVMLVIVVATAPHRPESTAVPSDPMIAPPRPEYTAAPCDSMIAAIL